LIAGGITLGIMILPIMIAASTEALKSVPQDFRNASYALGVTDWKTITNITLPAATPAITSGLILSMGRAIGETAAVLITAGYSALIVDSLMDPSASLPNMIYQYYDLAIKYPEVGAKVYSVALVLIMIILSLNITAKVITYLYRKKLYGT
jgi:phosphate transport system permease protein